MLIDIGVGDRVARWEAARHRHEIRDSKHSLGLIFNVPQNIGIGHALHRVVRAVAAGVKRWLEVDALHRRMVQAETNDSADFVFVHAALDGGNQDHRAADLRQPIERQ